MDQLKNFNGSSEKKKERNEIVKNETRERQKNMKM